MTNSSTNDAKGTILIIDDDKTQLSVVSETLKEFEVITAQNGKEGIAKVNGLTPDLIVLDIEMPETDGYEACSTFRSLPQTQTTPIVFYSALDNAESRLKAYDFGGNDYITKNGQPEEMAKKIRLLVSSQQERDAIQKDIKARSHVMMNMQRETSRMHIVSQFLQACQYCHDSDTLGIIFLNSLKKLQTRGIIFFKNEDLMISSNGSFTKLEAEILKNYQEFGRIHSFQGSRVLFNWRSMAVLVKDIQEMIDTIAYFMDAAENAYGAMIMQTKLIDQVIRIEEENRQLREKLSSTAEESKECLKEKLYTTGLISPADIQDEKDLDDILEPFGNDLTAFLSSMDHNSQNIKRLISGLKAHPEELEDYFKALSDDDDKQSDEGVLF